MAGEWRSVRLSDLLEVKHGYAFEGRYFTDMPPGPLLVTPGNFNIGGGFVKSKRYYTGPIPDEFVLSPHDVIVSMTDLSKAGDTLGYSAVVPNDGETYLHNQRIGKVVLTDPTATSVAFVGWLMRSPDYRHNVMAGATGSTVRHTSPSRIGSLNFLLPPRPEQDGIVGLLSCLEDKIALNLKVSETLEAIARVLFQSWFVDFDPVRRAAAGEDTGLPAHLATLFPKRFAAHGVPDGWEIKQVGDVYDIVGGNTPSTEDERFWGAPYAWTTPKDLSRLPLPVLLAPNRTLSEAGLAACSSGLLPVGTLLLSSRAPIGYLGFSNVPTAVNQGIAAFRRRNLSTSFAWVWCQAEMPLIKASANGSTFMEISKGALRRLSMIQGSQAVMEAFVAIVDPLVDRIVTIAEQNLVLSKLRDTLLPKLISGELRIPDAEKIEESA